MLIQDSDGVLRFDVRSYHSFVAAEMHSDGDDNEWLTRLHEVTDDLDVQSDPLHDAGSSNSGRSTSLSLP
jgi:hypothetical protein